MKEGRKIHPTEECLSEKCGCAIFSTYFLVCITFGYALQLRDLAANHDLGVTPQSGKEVNGIIIVWHLKIYLLFI